MFIKSAKVVRTFQFNEKYHALCAILRHSTAQTWRESFSTWSFRQYLEVYGHLLVARARYSLSCSAK